MDEKTKPWFWGAVVYQIYPRSFYDSNGDGVGDLNGIIEKLDYLAGTDNSLGVNAIWLCPFYCSPMADFGYDVSDYQDVDPIFGTLDNFKELVKQAHARDIKLIIDLVANHTSDEHPWFLESKSSLKNSKRDWYIWRKPKDGQSPNDWLSVFGGSAWQLDPQTGEYYLHSFSVKQPDLNWDNPEVRWAIKSVMRFWLDLGVDGFRADAIYWLSKDHRFRNDPINSHRVVGDSRDYDTLTHKYSRKGPHLYEYLHEIATVLKSYGQRFMVIEAVPEGGKEPTEYLKFYELVDEHHIAPFNFEGIYLSWKAPLLKSFINKFEAVLEPDYLPVYTLGNHDKPRLVSRVGLPSARTAAMMLLTLPGMPFIYYGEEIGMTNVSIPPDKQMDPQRVEGVDRDKFRSPLQWNSQKNAGFSVKEPWLPVSPYYKDVNIQTQLKDKMSLLNLYRQLIKLRSSSNILKLGIYEELSLHEKVYGFGRRLGDDRFIVILNISGSAVSLDLGAIEGKVILSTYQDISNKIVAKRLNLRPHEGMIINSGRRLHS